MVLRSLGRLTIDLLLKMGGFQSGMDQAARLAEDRARRIDRSLRGVKNAVTGAFAALGGATIFREVVQSTIESENALRQLEQRILSTGGAAQKTAQQLAGYASELQRASTFDDEAIIAAQTALLSFTNIQGDTFDRATRATLDLATALGQDLPSAARQLGLALNDPERGVSRLARAGISLDKAQIDLIKSLSASGRAIEAQNLLLSELEGRYGGAAFAAADTLGGVLKQLGNVWGDFFEASGSDVEEAKRALQEFRDILTSPQTAQTAAAFSSSIIASFGSIVRSANEVVGAVRFIGEEFAAMTKGVAEGDVVRLEDALQDALEVRRTASFSPSRMRFFGTGGVVEWWSDEELDQEISAIVRALQRARESVAPLLSSGESQKAAEMIVTPQIDLEMFKEDGLEFIEVTESILEPIRSMQTVFDEMDRRRVDGARQAADEMLQIERSYQDELGWMRIEGQNLAIGLLGRLGQESKAFAVAAIGVQAAMTAKSILFSSQQASWAALAPPPIGLGPIAGAPLAASLLTAGKINAALAIASGVVDAAQLFRSPSEARLSESTSSSFSAQSTSQPSRAGVDDVDRKQKVVNLHIHGNYYGTGGAQQLAEQLRDFIDGTDFVLVTPHSRNGMDLVDP